MPEGEKETIIIANREVTKLKQQITFMIKDGNQFPALTEIQRLLGMADPSGSGIFKDLARAQARVKIEEVTRIMAEMEATCSNLAATVVSLGEGLNEQSDLDAAVAEIRSTEDQYGSKARVALVHVAEAAGGGPPAVPPPPPPALPRPEVNRFMKISATAEPTNLPRDVTPGPPTSGEKLRQLRVYLGTAWQDVIETMDFEKASFEEIIQTLTDEISITFPVVRQRIELFSISDQMSTEGPWEFWRRVVLKCKNGAIGSREAGLDLNYDQFLITLFLKGLREADREKIQAKYMN